MDVGYRITGQRETSRLNPGGGFDPYIVVNFITDLGNTASVDIPKRLYTAELRNERVQALANELDA